eukprot:5380990-Pyramimonas_sp.AAC.1
MVDDGLELLHDRGQCGLVLLSHAFRVLQQDNARLLLLDVCNDVHAHGSARIAGASMTAS